jgi:hypothetical protein
LRNSRPAGDFLRDEAADGKAEHVDFAKTQRLDESDRVGAHFLEGGRHLSGAAGNSGIVEQDDLAVLGETIRHSRVPMVHGAGEMHVEDERHPTRLAEAAIGEADAVGFDELRRRGLVSVLGH